MRSVVEVAKLSIQAIMRIANSLFIIIVPAAMPDQQLQRELMAARDELRNVDTVQDVDAVFEKYADKVSS